MVGLSKPSTHTGNMKVGLGLGLGLLLGLGLAKGPGDGLGLGDGRDASLHVPVGHGGWARHTPGSPQVGVHVVVLGTSQAPVGSAVVKGGGAGAGVIGSSAPRGARGMAPCRVARVPPRVPIPVGLHASGDVAWRVRHPGAVVQPTHRPSDTYAINPGISLATEGLGEG